MRRDLSHTEHGGAIPPCEVACECALRYLRLVGYGQGGRCVRIHASDDRGTHWLFTFAESSLEDPSRNFMYANIVVEKETGHIYDFPSRTLQPIDMADFTSIRRDCGRITPEDLAQLEAEARGRQMRCQPPPNQ
jgi:hypothetical protein